MVILSGTRCRFAYDPVNSDWFYFLVLPFWYQLTRVVVVVVVVITVMSYCNENVTICILCHTSPLVEVGAPTSLDGVAENRPLNGCSVAYVGDVWLPLNQLGCQFCWGLFTRSPILVFWGRSFPLEFAYCCLTCSCANVSYLSFQFDCIYSFIE